MILHGYIQTSVVLCCQSLCLMLSLSIVLLKVYPRVRLDPSNSPSMNIDLQFVNWLVGTGEEEVQEMGWYSFVQLGYSNFM